MAPERLQKALARAGFGSRRACEQLIAEGRVTLDDTVATLGDKVEPGVSKIRVNGLEVNLDPSVRYYALHKPIGVITTMHDPQGRPDIRRYLPLEGPRIFPVGRLDRDSEGLLLLTNDGTWAERVLHPRYGHEREYDVAVEGDLTDDALARLQRGIPLEEGIARAVRVAVRSRSRGRSRISMVLRTGWKRQVRRMCLAVGLKVTRLVRVRMGPLELGRLRPGEFRDLTKREIDAMTAPTAEPKPQAPQEPARPIAPRVPRRESVPSSARPMTRPGNGREFAPRVRSPGTARGIAPRAMTTGNARGIAPRVTRRAAASRARVEGPRRQWSDARTVQAGRPTRERDARAVARPAARLARGAAAGPAARPPLRRRSTRAAAGRAAPRRAARG